MSVGGYSLLLGRPGGIGWWPRLGLAALGGAILWWAALGSQVSFGELAKGLPWIGDFLSRMVPPNWAFLDKLWKPAIETVQIAIWGTLLAILLAVPVCFLAARNLAPNRAVFHAMRQVFNVARGINEIILALIFVAAVGLGPFPGVLALAVHGAGMLGKFFSESIEEIDHGPIEALRATGAGPVQTIIFGVLPQVITAWIAVVLYRFETNLRQATVLGMVGAGGIGFELVGSMKLFQYQDTATCIVVIIVMVMAADYISTRLRAWIQKGAH
jgi:phosphonate transport system permease protein